MRKLAEGSYWDCKYSTSRRPGYRPTNHVESHLFPSVAPAVSHFGARYRTRWPLANRVCSTTRRFALFLISSPEYQTIMCASAKRMVQSYSSALDSYKTNRVLGLLMHSTPRVDGFMGL